MSRPARSLKASDLDGPVPVYVVWEITLRCDHACSHCGSRAGPFTRETELETHELLEVADALGDLGAREITLIGGEAYLRSDVYELVTHIANKGIRVTMQTGGRGLTLNKARRFKDAGLNAIGVSIDGPQAVHDELRNAPGSFAAALNALEYAQSVGLITTSNSQLNRLNRPFLRETAALLENAGVRVWRTQLTAPMGRAADTPDWILQPWMILDVMETLAEIQTDAIDRARADGAPLERAFNVSIGNNMGYYGPHEQLLRNRPQGADRYWTGCAAGKWVMGIESDGTIKGCPSLPTTPYVGGNVRDQSLREIWEADNQVAFTRTRRDKELWGFCKGCYYADVCQAGCSFTAHSTLGKRGNYPFCWHRANEHRKNGQREMLVHAVDAPGTPYDFGAFTLDVEPWDGKDTEPTPRPTRARGLPVVQ